MGTRTSYPPGTPSWVDVQAADIAAAREFYAALFGWVPQVAPQPEAGGYTMFTLDGSNVAGGGPTMGEGMGDVWSVYMTVDDVDATAATVVAAGGATLAGPFDIFDSGRSAVFADSQGTPFAVWQPNQHIGAEQVNSLGCFCWNELATADVDDSKRFYGEVFGWAPVEHNPGAAIFSLGGRVICGAHAAGEHEPPFWTIWFTVADCDEAVARATSLGASVYLPPNDMGFGRGAIIAAPGGAVLGLATLNDPDD